MEVQIKFKNLIIFMICAALLFAYLFASDVRDEKKDKAVSSMR